MQEDWLKERNQVYLALYNCNPDFLNSDCDCDILAIDIETAKNNFPKTDKPVMICGEDFGPDFIRSLDRECIISYITEKTYKHILPAVIEGNHYAVLKTPIDINLAKELNILATDMGLSRDRIIMNTDIGGLGYGYEYGYSIIEKIIQERENDEYLNFPIISEASLESLKTKEAKSDQMSESWGDLETRAQMIELTSALGVIAAGTNITVLKNPQNVNIIKGLLK